jgi:hypothetical protein
MTIELQVAQLSQQPHPGWWGSAIWVIIRAACVPLLYPAIIEAEMSEPLQLLQRLHHTACHPKNRKGITAQSASEREGVQHTLFPSSRQM